ncbi:MAG: hypothetical protein DME98_07910 [Verrucomicrobia bacterium]|nr:MAG: hypothetical protein DME98_07910 [Verrucomicrobiota bacterium]
MVAVRKRREGARTRAGRLCALQKSRDCGTKQKSVLFGFHTKRVGVRCVFASLSMCTLTFAAVRQSASALIKNKTAAARFRAAAAVRTVSRRR